MGMGDDARARACVSALQSAHFFASQNLQEVKALVRRQGGCLDINPVTAGRVPVQSCQVPVGGYLAPAHRLNLRVRFITARNQGWCEIMACVSGR